MPGSTAERLLHGAPCPVAVVPKHYRVPETHALRKIGVAYESAAAVDGAVELMRATAGELTGVLRAGDPVRELAAQSHRLELVVTGATGRLLREVACPVVVVPRRIAAPLAGLSGDAAQAQA